MNETGIRLDAIDEAALRLRNLGAWDNKLGDAFQILIQQVRSLEHFAGIHMAKDENDLPTKIKTWDDFDKRMVLFLHSFIESGVRVHVHSCDFLLLARMSGEWKKQDATPPTTLRMMNFGTVVVEWEKPGCSLMLDRGYVSPIGEEKDFRKHKLLKIEKTKTLFEREP